MECRIHSSNPHILNKIPTNKPKKSSNSSLFHAKFKTHKISSSLSSSNQTKLPASGTDTYTIEFKTKSNSRLGISWYPDFEYNAQGGRGTGVAKKTVDGDSDGDFSVNFDLETLYIPPLTSATTKFLGLPLPPFLRIDIVPEVFEGIIHKNSGKAECYHYLFDAAIKLNQLGLHWTTPQHGPLPKSTAVVGGHESVNMSVKLGSNGAAPSRRCIVLDIEGTTTPISFVSDVLFPYARTNVGRHLDASYETAETHDDIELLRTQVEDDLKQGIAGATPIPSKDMGKEEVIAALVANVEAMIKSDRKITALKQLQGHIWRTGFNSNELQGIVFDDVPKALKEWHDMGIKVYIYSSGSRLAQRLLFGNTNHGDLRKYLCGYFDTTVGGKKETISYVEIFKSLGVNDSSEILFVTDVYQEAVAAKAAGWEVIISVRPGNGPLPENHGFMTVNSFSEI